MPEDHYREGREVSGGGILRLAKLAMRFTSLDVVINILRTGSFRQAWFGQVSDQ